MLGTPQGRETKKYPEFHGELKEAAGESQADSLSGLAFFKLNA